MKAKLAHPQIDQITKISERIGSNVRLARKRRGWTQLLMAEKIGVSLPTYRDFEAGRSTVSQAILISVVLALGGEEDLMHLLDPEKDVIGIAAQKRLKRVVPDNDF